MTVFKGGEAIKEFLEEFDSWLSESVTVYLLGGSAMTVRGLKDQTEDIDLAVGVVSEFEHVYQTLTSQGFTVVDEPTESFEGVGKPSNCITTSAGFESISSNSKSSGKSGSQTGCATGPKSSGPGVS